MNDVCEERIDLYGESLCDRSKKSEAEPEERGKHAHRTGQRTIRGDADRGSILITSGAIQRVSTLMA